MEIPPQVFLDGEFYVHLRKIYKKKTLGWISNSIYSKLFNTTNLSLNEVDFITISRDPNHNKLKKILFALKNPLNIFNYYQR